MTTLGPALQTRAPADSQGGALSSSLATQLQALGARLVGPTSMGVGRVGGAGPSDHKAVTIDGQTLMIPVYTHAAQGSPFTLRVDLTGLGATLFRGATRLGRVAFPRTPRFYDLRTEDGVPYHKLATLHGNDVLATTVLQHCVRYGNRATSCQFCAIGQSLKGERTVAKKTPAQLAEVAAAAVHLDGVRHMVLTTGTPPSDDRGARVLSECTAAIRAAVDLPVQAQCEPPADLEWLRRMHDAGVSTLGMHLEAVSEPVRARIMPGKAEVSVERYLEAFEFAVEVFGHGQVTTYILAGLGDSSGEIIAMASRLARMGVYPFVVPFVPIAGTPLEHHPTPATDFMEDVLSAVADAVAEAGLHSQDIEAGCGRCGACSTLRARETGT